MSNGAYKQTHQWQKNLSLPLCVEALNCISQAEGGSFFAAPALGLPTAGSWN